MGLVLICASFASVSDMAGCASADESKGISSLEHESKCTKVYVIFASSSPKKDSCSGRVRYFDDELTDRNAK